MKRILLALTLAVCTMASAHAMLFLTADGLGAGKSAVTGSLAIPGSNITELGGGFTYGINADVDAFGHIGLQQMSGASQTVLGGGAKGLFMKASTSVPVDLAWLGDLSYISVTGGSSITLIGGVIASKQIDMLTPYGLLGLSYSSTTVSIGGFSATSSNSGLALGGGVRYDLASNMNVKGEILIANSGGTSNTGFGAAFQYILN